MKRLLSLLSVLLLSGCAATGGGLLTIDGNRIVTLVEPAYDVQAPAGYGAAGPVALVSGSGAETASLAAWLGEDAFVLVRAARGGAAADRSRLPDFELPCGRFPSRTFCVSPAKTDASTEDGLALLEDNGFAVTPALWIRQLFRAGAPGGAETVFTYGERVPACLTPVASVQAAFDTRLRERLAVTELGVDCALPDTY